MTPRPGRVAAGLLPALLLAACTQGPGGFETPVESASLAPPPLPTASLAPAESSPPLPVLPPLASLPGETPGGG